MGVRRSSNGHRRTFSRDPIRHDYPLSVYNTIREKADERLYNVRRMPPPVTSAPFASRVRSRNDEEAKSARCFIRNNEIINTRREARGAKDAARALTSAPRDERRRIGSSAIESLRKATPAGGGGGGERKSRAVAGRGARGADTVASAGLMVFKLA